jgi:hypothetical protein
MCVTGFCMMTELSTAGIQTTGIQALGGDMFTLTTLLQDPLTRLMMRSDGVTEEHFSSLMLRVQHSLDARSGSDAVVAL